MPKIPDVPKFLGSTEVCQLIGINRATLTRWIQSGRIAYAQKIPGPNGVYLFDPGEVERVHAEYEASKVAS